MLNPSPAIANVAGVRAGQNYRWISDTPRGLSTRHEITWNYQFTLPAPLAAKIKPNVTLRNDLLKTGCFLANFESETRQKQTVYLRKTGVRYEIGAFIPILVWNLRKCRHVLRLPTPLL